MIAVRRLALAAMAGAAFVLSGCASPARESAPAPAREQHYTETISSVLVSGDDKRIAAIGSGHHYIFTAPEVLVKALRSPVHPQLTATFTTFHIDQRGIVTGDWLLTLVPDASPAARAQASEVGLVAGPDGVMAAGGILKGQRFTGWTYALRGPHDKLNKPTTIDITIDASTADNAVDEAATPIRMAADGVQLIYWAPLAPVIVPVLFLGRAKDH
ncbi:hypothetical protein [Scleromatobacter humisilvae]|uniref:Lipoprotein n=1 Tax=Scleromatobacter humisilvae TaxID=2897159 RepID=A0A9X1YLY5_9BURK|nr:hypothetical protein [Scleromatobacter humisilvae]MCK9688391.1 hypothetical protein [Scleromatobacter humisilvae]